MLLPLRKDEDTEPSLLLYTARWGFYMQGYEEEQKGSVDVYLFEILTHVEIESKQRLNFTRETLKRLILDGT